MTADLALLPPNILRDPRETHGPARRQWQGIPGFERSPMGRFWATWYSGGAGEGPGNFSVLATSDDAGASWREPVLAIAVEPPMRVFDPVLWLDPLGRLWFFWAQSKSHIDGRCGVWAIVTEQPDHPEPRWSEPRRLAHGIMMNKPTVLADGSWLMCSAIWNRQGKKKPETPPISECAHLTYSNVYRSINHGQSWTHIGSADVPQRGCDEHMIVERRDGKLWMLVRTQYGIGQSFSPNGGIAWSPGVPTGIVGPETRFFIRRLNSGRLLLVYHDHPRERINLAAWLSDDDGATWPHKLLLDDREKVSYPDGVETPDGQLLIIYDRQRTADREILLARFREDDILAGRPVSNDTKLREIVNRP